MSIIVVDESGRSGPCERTVSIWPRRSGATMARVQMPGFYLAAAAEMVSEHVRYAPRQQQYQIKLIDINRELKQSLNQHLLPSTMFSG